VNWFEAAAPWEHEMNCSSADMNYGEDVEPNFITGSTTRGTLLPGEGSEMGKTRTFANARGIDKAPQRLITELAATKTEVHSLRALGSRAGVVEPLSPTSTIAI
jgi:hypothetical protein